MSWRTQRLLGLDVESTSVDVEDARIVSATLAWVGGGEEPQLATMIVNPGIEIPEEAARIHGITTDVARAEGRPPENALAWIVDGLELAAAMGWAVCAFNARYDLTVIDREIRRHGVATEDGWLERLLVVDGLVLDKHLDRYRKGSRKLEALCGHYGASLDRDEAHGSAPDAIAAARLAWVIARRGEVVRRTRTFEDEIELTALREEWSAVREDLPALHACQRVWAAEQDEFFAKREHRDVVPWPWIPFKERVVA